MFKVLHYFKKDDVVEEMPKQFIIDGHKYPKVLRAKRDYIFEENLGLVAIENIQKEIERAKKEREDGIRSKY